MALRESGEDYLETILILHDRTGYVRSIDVANELGYSKPSISRAMGILRENGFITVERDGQILLTETGRQKASEVYERHLLLTKFFHEILGVGMENAENDACHIEHDISVETFEKLRKFVDAHKK
ncbi:MAG: metal-dependent transcriptional regulator [Ruminococcus sp.]|nr:metal-dependent transcriptional regulator [Ruminococcus sp.]